MTAKGGNMYKKCSILKDVPVRTSGSAGAVDPQVKLDPLSVDGIRAANTTSAGPTTAQVNWLIAEVDRLTKENEAHKEFTVARVKVLAQKLDCSEGLPDDNTIYGCVGTILGMFRLRVEVLVSERDKYKTALEGIAEHLKLPCDKRDDGVLEQIAAKAVRP